MKDDEQSNQDDSWLIQSLGDADNWNKLESHEKDALRKTQGYCCCCMLILVAILCWISIMVLHSGNKTSTLTSAIAIIAAVFPTSEKLLSSAVEYHQSRKDEKGELFQFTRLKFIARYLNVYALLFATTALFDLCIALATNRWN